MPLQGLSTKLLPLFEVPCLMQLQGCRNSQFRAPGVLDRPEIRRCYRDDHAFFWQVVVKSARYFLSSEAAGSQKNMQRLFEGARERQRQTEREREIGFRTTSRPASIHRLGFGV